MVSAAFAYRLPPGTDPIATAPLLCAGIIGYRALSRATFWSDRDDMAAARHR